MNRLLPLLGLSLLALSACQFPVPIDPPETNSVPSASSSSSITTEEGPLEAGDVAASTASKSTPVAGSGSYAYSERVTPEGYLEIGAPQAALTMRMYTNHACAYCADFAKEQLPRLQEDFMAQGQLTLQIALLPFIKYPNSDAEAAALLCAARQGRGQEMHLELFALTPRTPAGIDAVAKRLALDKAAFDTCRKDPATQSLLAAQQVTTRAQGITLAPTFVLDGESTAGLPYYPDLRGMLKKASKSRRAM